MSKKKINLTDKQEGFAVSFVMNGGDATAAYRENYAHEKMKDSTLWVKAHEARHHGKVSARIHELRIKKISPKILSIEERKKLLSERALDGDNKALDMLNKMEGVYIEKIEATVNGVVEYTQLPEKNQDC